MKIALIFLAIFVAVSHQQYRLQRMDFPFQSHLIPQSVYYNNFLKSRQTDSLIGRYNPIIILIKNEETKNPEENKYTDIQPRMKSSLNKRLDNEKLNPRFLWNLFGLTTTSSFGNFLLKTVTLTLSSTCTALSFVTCVPRANIDPAAPAVVATCARKREIDSDQITDKDNIQFPIAPSQVRQVEPTIQPILARNPRQTSINIVSSKGEGGVINQGIQELQRMKRFYYLWQSFATATTITSWSIISSVSTSTLIPRNAAGVAVNLPCLPAGFSICAQAGK